MNSIKQLLILTTAILGVFFSGCIGPQPIDFQAPALDTAKPWTDCPFKNDPNDFQFAIVTDRTGGCRPGVFKKAMYQVNLLQPEFVMCVGDLIKGHTKDRDTVKHRFDEMDTILDSLEMRFFRVVGNNDIGNSVMADVYRERYTLPYYHFVYKNALFLIVSTEDPPPKANISDTQINYIKKVLQDTQSVRWTFIFMHRPLFVEQEGKLHEGWAKIENMLAGRGHTVFAGHWHTYAKHEKHGQNYIRLATTGGASNLSGIGAGEFDHIVWVTMTDQGPRIANLLLDGIYDENVNVAE